MYDENTKKVIDNINIREKNCSTFLSNLGIGGMKNTLSVIVLVLIAFKKSKYFLKYTHLTNIRVNFIKILKNERQVCATVHGEKE